MNATEEQLLKMQRPAYWYDIPQGYLRLDVYPSAERMDHLARQILALPQLARKRAEKIFRLYAIVMWEMQKRRVQGCAMGMHPDDRGGVTTSVLTVSSVEMQGVSPKAVVATLVASGAGKTDGGIVPLELPCGVGFVTEATRRLHVPGVDGSDGDAPADEAVWQGTVAIPDKRSSAVVAVQLVTSSVNLVDDYRNVLLGVAHSVTFDDPSPGDGAGPMADPQPGSAAAAVRSDFG